MCASCPQACMRPGSVDEYDSPVRSSHDSASISALSAIVGPWSPPWSRPPSARPPVLVGDTKPVKLTHDGLGGVDFLIRELGYLWN